MYDGCVQGALAVGRLPVFAFIARLGPGVGSGNTSRVKCPGEVFVMADAWWHGPASNLRPVGDASLERAGGPGGIACRSRCTVHGSQIEGQVLWSGLLKGRLHHVLVVMLPQLGSSLSLILHKKWAQINIKSNSIQSVPICRLTVSSRL